MNKFPIDTLPPVVGNLLRQLPIVVGSRPEYGALGVLWATTLCAPTTKVQIKDKYRIGLNLYGAIIADKGDSKSPALGFTVGPLIKKFENEISKYGKTYQAWLKRLEMLRRDRTKSGTEKIESHMLNEPKPPWWGVVTMGTSEGIRDTAKNNAMWEHPPFIGQFSEELDSWIKAMGKYAKNGGDGGEMAFYLQAYDGDVTIKANKGEKDSTPKFRLGVLGTIQPKVFRSAFEGKIENGLMDRFMIVTGRKESEEIDPYMTFPGSVVEDYDRFISDLFEDDQEEVILVHPECLDMGREMYKWICANDKNFKAEAKSKWWVHFHKIAGILAVLWKRKNIDKFIMEKAMELTKYMILSWCASFRAMSLTDVDELEMKVTGFLREGPHSKSALSKRLDKNSRPNLSVCLENMEESGLIEIQIRKASNGREVNEYRIV